jgi:hypothetical protein
MAMMICVSLGGGGGAVSVVSVLCGAGGGLTVQAVPNTNAETNAPNETAVLRVVVGTPFRVSTRPRAAGKQGRARQATHPDYGVLAEPRLSRDRLRTCFIARVRHNQPISGDEDPRDRLSRLFAGQTQSATPQQRAAVRRWQGRDRFYEKVQGAAAGNSDSIEAMRVAESLGSLARPLPEDTELWRGIRSTARAFGLNTDDLNALIGRNWVEERFMSTTTSRDVALTEFNRPSAAPAIIHITARAGASAVWVPPLGDAENAGQSELLFAPGIGVRILSVDRSGDVSVIEMEVTSG